MIVSKEKFKPAQEISARELDKMKIKPITWLVDGILPTGLAVISAPPKYYKSYMMLDLCIQICTGGKFLGRQCTKKDCLYIDLESTERRPQTRLNQILGKDTEKPDNLYIITANQNVGTLGDTFIQQLESQMNKHPNIGLIIVDVFQLIRPPKKSAKDAYQEDYDTMKPLKEFVAKYDDVNVMLVHHNRKGRNSADSFDNMSGSNGILASVDCSWVIDKEKRMDNEAVLNITGRDLDSAELKMKYNKATYRWEYMGTKEDIDNQRAELEYKNNHIRKTIVKLVQQNGGEWQGTASDIRQASYYFKGFEISERAEKVGKFINNNKEFLLWLDNIDVKDKSHRMKVFTTVPTVQTDTTVPTVQTVQDNKQIELDL